MLKQKEDSKPNSPLNNKSDSPQLQVILSHTSQWKLDKTPKYVPEEKWTHYGITIIYDPATREETYGGTENEWVGREDERAVDR